MTVVAVNYNSEPYGGQPVRMVYGVEGEPSESFLSALIRTVGDSPDGQLLQLATEPVEGVVFLHAIVDADVTMAEVEAFADGEALPIDIQGRGGGEMSLLVSLARGSVATGRFARRTFADIRYDEDRRLARNWLDSGVHKPPMELLQRVNSESRWERAHFDRVFGLDADPGSRLLRECGFRKITDRPDIWVDEKE